MKPAISYSTFPRTEAPPAFVEPVVTLFRAHAESISTAQLTKGLTSDQVLLRLADDLSALGFEVEKGKKSEQKVEARFFW